MNDLISRRAAIDLIENDKIGGDSPFISLPRAQVVNRTCDRHVEGVKNLPSAQPEIVRCKGCRFYALSPYTTHGIKICQKWGGVRMDDDFCSRGERKEDG